MQEARYVKPTGENTLLLITEGKCSDCKQRQQDKKHTERKGEEGNEEKSPPAERWDWTWGE